MRRRQGIRGVAGLLAALLGGLALAACGTPEVRVGAESTDAPDPGEAAATAEPADPDEPSYSCFSAPRPASAWRDAPPADDVEHPGREALLGELRSDLDGWLLLEASDERLTVFREIEGPPDPHDDILRTHEIVSVADFGGETGWHMEQWSSCAPQLVLDDAGSAEVWLDGAPDPAAATVDVLVMELACASGRSAAGRIRVAQLTETDDAVEVVLGVEPIPGGADCPGNPATPFTLDLAEPLGDRTVIDASVLPARPMDEAPEELRRG